MCVWRVGEHELCFSDVGGSCGVVDHRVLGHFNWVRVFARITASVVLVSHSGASRAQRATSSSRQVVAVRRDPDILQADPRWGYDSGGGSVFESPLVAGWSYLEHLQIINSISTQFDEVLLPPLQVLYYPLVALIEGEATGRLPLPVLR